MTPPAPARLRLPPTLLFGRGAVDRLPALLGELGVRRPLLATDPDVAATGLPGRLVGELAAAGLVPRLWDGLAPDPDERHPERLRDRLLAGGCDGLVGIGGGSVLDAAKVAAVLATHGGTTADYFGSDRARRPALPLVLVPTTAGGGGEVSSHAVILQLEPRKKEVVAGLQLLARATIVDPDTHRTLPFERALPAALDGLVHAIEAYLARAATPLTDPFARLAVADLAVALPALAADPDDPAARERLALGGLRSGIAMANTNAGAIHALGYPLSGERGVPHGVANAIVAAATLERVAPAHPQRAAELAELLGSRAEATALPEAVRTLLDGLGFRDTLRFWGFTEEDLPRLAELAGRFGPVLENTPRRLERPDLLAIYRDAWTEATDPRKGGKT